MGCPTSFQNFWSAFENNIDIAAYKKICRDFHVSPVSNWRQKVDLYSRGLGIACYYDDGYVPVWGKDYDNSSLNIPFSSDNDYSDATMMSFGDHPATYTAAYISQSPQTAKAWVKFSLDESQGFKDIGTERINDSIRTYVYAILGAQAQAKTGILTPGTGLDAKREFLNILEASIDSPVDLQDSIQRYQNSLQYARSQLNFVVGEGLYLLPSDMNLRIGTYEGYNNNILIATSDLSLGSNYDTNSSPTVEVSSSSIDSSISNLSSPSSDDVESIADDIVKERQLPLPIPIRTPMKKIYNNRYRRYWWIRRVNLRVVFSWIL